jgi:hypothetical protein
MLSFPVANISIKTIFFHPFLLGKNVILYNNVRPEEGGVKCEVLGDGVSGQ